jgi:Domain of unknown function (DUF4440)
MAPSSLETEITTLEDGTWKALTKGGEGLLPFLAPDCSTRFPTFMKISVTSEPALKQVLASNAFIPWTSYEMRDVTVLPLSTKAAVIAYRAVASRQYDGDVKDFEALVPSTWRNDVTGRWQLVLRQQTPILPV